MVFMVAARLDLEIETCHGLDFGIWSFSPEFQLVLTGRGRHIGGSTEYWVKYIVLSSSNNECKMWKSLRLIRQVIGGLVIITLPTVLAHTLLGFSEARPMRILSRKIERF